MALNNRARGGIAFILLMLVISLRPAFSQKASDYETERQKLVGLSYDQNDFPAGYEDLGGHLIEKGPDMKYAVTHVNKEGMRFLWLEKVHSGSREGTVSYEIKDILLLPEIRQGKMLVQGTCLIRGEDDPEIIAIVKDDKKIYLRNIVKAWRANSLKGIFEALNTDNIVCINDGL